MNGIIILMFFFAAFAVAGLITVTIEKGIKIADKIMKGRW